MAIPANLKKLIGKSTKPRGFQVEKSQIRRFASAVGEHSPIHYDEAAAKAAGFASLAAPPTFLASLQHLEPLWETLDVDAGGLMHAEEEYEYFRPICAGDEVFVSHQVTDAYDKNAPNGKLVFLVLETRGVDKRGRDVFKGRRVLVELKK